MSTNIAVLIFLLSILYITIGIVGYIAGRISCGSQAFLGSPLNKNKTLLNNELHQHKITIDESKFVTEINTSGIEKKYEKLGETKVSEDAISQSVNKLKNLKR